MTDTAAPTPAPATTTERLDEIFKALNRSDAPGGVIGIARHGQSIYRRGFGLASIEHGVANTTATRMRIGSTSKHFTCFTALLLAEDGLLDLDAPASTYLPELPPLQGMPTLRQFMQHTSGYRCYLDLGMLANGLSHSTPGAPLATMLRQQAVNFRPGDGQLYCNGGYLLLSVAIDRVAGKPFEQVLKERVLAPLGMHDTEGLTSDMTIVPSMVSMHSTDPKGGWKRGTMHDVRGEGNMISTIDDMLRWTAHLRADHKLVGNAATWEQLLQPARLVDGFESVYSLGLFKHRYRGVEVIHHAGGVLGGNSQMLCVPTHGLDIAIMLNSDSASATELTMKVVDALLADDNVLSAPIARPAKSAYEHLIGTRYADAEGMLIGFGEVEGQLGLNFLGNPPMKLRDEGEQLRIGFEDVAMGPFTLRTAELAAGADGQAPARLAFSETGRVRQLQRLPATPPDTLALGAELVGRYHSHDANATATIALAGDALTLQIQGGYGDTRAVLSACSENLYVMGMADQPTHSLGVLMPTRGGPDSVAVSGLRITSGRTRHLAFTRIVEQPA